MEFKNSKSISLQIADNISEKIINGFFPVGEKIPSVRELAMDMGVNPNTIVRSYAELQARMIIENKRGIGYFVNENAQSIIFEWKRKDFFENDLPEFVRQMGVLNLSIEDLKPQIENLLTTSTNEN